MASGAATCPFFAEIGGHFSLANRLVENGDTPPILPTNNGAIHTLCQIIKTVMSSAAEAEIGATFLNSKDALPIRTTLEELGHPQPPPPCKSITPHQWDLQTIPSSRNGQRKLTCASTGSEIALVRVNSRFTVPPEAPTSGTTTPNTTPQAIIA